ncbi:hypothetical protein R1sor_013067 [Riccia sorocarpa]|uniref:Uncharacterized protein n=1 Tax=Riccia sorocarpa TaxID=122646 RepID=A0ABD3H5M9_9MARC
MMDADDEYVATLPAKDVTPSTLSTSGRRVASEPSKEKQNYSRILEKLCLRVQSDAEAIEKNPGELAIALNAGSRSPVTSSCGIEYSEDGKFVGGDILRTDENIM